MLAQAQQAQLQAHHVQPSLHHAQAIPQQPRMNELSVHPHGQSHLNLPQAPMQSPAPQALQPPVQAHTMASSLPAGSNAMNSNNSSQIVQVGSTGVVPDTSNQVNYMFVPTHRFQQLLKLEASQQHLHNQLDILRLQLRQVGVEPVV